MSRTAREVIADYIDASCDETMPAAAGEVIAALDAAGFVIMPKEPTEKILGAPEKAEIVVGPSPGCFIDPDEAREIYRAMIAAAKDEAEK